MQKTTDDQASSLELKTTGLFHKTWRMKSWQIGEYVRSFMVLIGYEFLVGDFVLFCKTFYFVLLILFTLLFSIHWTFTFVSVSLPLKPLLNSTECCDLDLIFRLYTTVSALHVQLHFLNSTRLLKHHSHQVKFTGPLYDPEHNKTHIMPWRLKSLHILSVLAGNGMGS